MSKIVCTICGSSDFIKTETHYKCKVCNITYTKDEVLNLLQNASDHSSVDIIQEVDNLYILARRAADDNNSELALKYYEQLAIKYPFDWEANFFQVFYRAIQCKIAEIDTYADRVCNAAKTSLDLINDHLDITANREEAIINILGKCFYLANSFSASASDWYNDCAYSVRSQFTQNYLNYTYGCIILLYEVADKADSLFGNRYSEINNECVALWKEGIKKHNLILNKFENTSGHINKIRQVALSIKKYETYYEPYISGTSYTQTTQEETSYTSPSSYQSSSSSSDFNVGLFIVLLIFFGPLAIIYAIMKKKK